MAQNTRPLKLALAYPNKTIAQLCSQINIQLAALKQVKAVLPKELQDHVLHCVLNNKKLLVYTDSANWASQLRFYAKAMLAAIDSTPVYTVQVKIITVPSVTQSPKRSAITPSQAVTEDVHNQSFITADPQLKQALNKLSSTLRKLQRGDAPEI